VTAYHSGIPILQDAIKDKSVLDTLKILHAFPRRYEYVRPCDAVDEETGEQCNKGYYGTGMLGGTRRMCKSCNGSGQIVHRSEQDVVRLSWPINNEDLVDISRLSHTEILPSDVPQQLEAALEGHKLAFHLAVFNQENTVKTTPQTATEVAQNYDRIYNKLSVFARKVEEAFEVCYRVAFQYFGVGEYEVDFTYPLDFKLKTLETLLGELKLARDSGAPYWVIREITFDIIQKQNRNAPDWIAFVKAIEAHRPWTTKSPEEIQLITASRSLTDPEYLVWSNFERITNRIWFQIGAAFSQLEYEAQEQLVYTAASLVASTIQYNQIPGVGEGE
jgi:hypothetical protein